MWTDKNFFQSVHEVFCEVEGPHSDHNFADMIISQNIFDKELAKLITVQITLYCIFSHAAQIQGHDLELRNGKM
jgi:hypothetical protein